MIAQNIPRTPNKMASLGGLGMTSTWTPLVGGGAAIDSSMARDGNWYRSFQSNEEMLNEVQGPENRDEILP
jgi:hypothetical protein